MACRKRRYRDRLAAELALATLRRRDDDRHTEARTYRCPGCRGWHLTSQSELPTRSA